jgi:hypothetical protein
LIAIREKHMRPQSTFDTALHQLRHDHAVLSLELEQIKWDYYARKFNPDQPRVPAGSSDGGQWGGGGGGQATVKPAFFDPRREAARKAVEAALALFAQLSAQNSPGQQTIFNFNARGFRPDGAGGLDFRSIQTLGRDEVSAACPRLGEVQDRTDRITADVNRETIGLSPSQFGTEVHTRLKNEIKNLRDPDFNAEVSFLKSKEADRYGQIGSIRVDVDERVNSRTVCVYDIKTGTSGLTLPRMVEIAGRVYASSSQIPTRIIVIEVRPR